MARPFLYQNLKEHQIVYSSIQKVYKNYKVENKLAFPHFGNSCKLESVLGLLYFATILVYFFCESRN